MNNTKPTKKSKSIGANTGDRKVTQVLLHMWHP